MTRKQMEQKIEELAAELRELKAQKQGCCSHHGCNCVHWHYSWQPSVAYTLPYQYTTTTGTGYNYQITS